MTDNEIKDVISSILEFGDYDFGMGDIIDTYDPNVQIDNNIISAWLPMSVESCITEGTYPFNKDTKREITDLEELAISNASHRIYNKYKDILSNHGFKPNNFDYTELEDLGYDYMGEEFFEYELDIFNDANWGVIIDAEIKNNSVVFSMYVDDESGIIVNSYKDVSIDIDENKDKFTNDVVKAINKLVKQF